jgi:hypothetical protein
MREAHFSLIKARDEYDREMLEIARDAEKEPNVGRPAVVAALEEPFLRESRVRSIEPRTPPLLTGEP